VASFAVAQGAHEYAELAAAKPKQLSHSISELPAWLDRFSE
jgi:hypothetical protein